MKKIIALAFLVSFALGFSASLGLIGGRFALPHTMASVAETALMTFDGAKARAVSISSGEAPKALAPQPPPAPEGAEVPALSHPPTTVTFNVVGDIGFGSQHGTLPRFESHFREKGPAYFVEDANTYFQRADFNMANLENVFTDATDYQPGKIYAYKVYSKDYIQVLTEGNIGYVNVINNHMQDYKDQGFQDTLALLADHGIVPFGTNLTPTGNPELGDIMTDQGAIFEKDDLKIGLLGFSAFGLNPPAPGVVEDRVQSLRDQGCDFIVAHMHGGGQNTHQVYAQQVTMAHRLIDAGADMVAGHHPHALQKTEIYKGKKIYYSLGNFLFTDYGSSPYSETIIVNVQVTKDQDGIDVQYINIPYLFTGVYGGNTYRPTQVADGAVVVKIENILGEPCY